MAAALVPATPAPRTTTLAGRTPGTPPRRTPLPPAGSHQRGSADHDGQAACDLGHGGEQRKGAAFLHGFVGDGRDAGVDELGGELGLCGEVQVGEEDQALAEAVVLGRDGFLDLHDHVRTAPDVVSVVDDFGAGDRVFLVGDARAEACAALNQNGVSVGAELVDTCGRDGYAEFVVLDFFGDADDHLWAPSLAASSAENVLRAVIPE